MFYTIRINIIDQKAYVAKYIIYVFKKLSLNFTKEQSTQK